MAKTTTEAGVTLIGDDRPFFEDLYHTYLRLSLGQAIGVIVAGLVALNSLFALIYLVTGGIANADDGSFLDAFSFSIQTLATIGYGAMYPETATAKIVSDVEALAGLVATAVATGLVFTRLTRPAATLRFTRNAVITRHDGQPALLCRVANERGNLLVDATARLVFMRREPRPDGELFYRMIDLPLVRHQSISFTRSWTLIHLINPDSPLWGATFERLVAEEAEISALVTGTDDTSLLPMHARTTWGEDQILLNHRLADLLRSLPDGSLEADVRRFDLVEPDDQRPLWG